MSMKEFIPYDEIRNNAIRLAHEIHAAEFVPDIIYVSLRGGAYMGNVISEYFKFVRRGQRPVFYAAVVARSYTDIHSRERVSVDGWTYSPEHLRSGDRVLVIDDIFDTGRTVNHLAAIILEKGIPRADLKVAVHDYKIRQYADEHLPIQPDFWCRKHEIKTPAEDQWIHYLSHEMVGLVPDEIDAYYKDPEVRSILRELP